MGDFDSKAVSNMLWACATLEWTAKDFLEAIGEQAMEVAGSMTPQALAMTIWSFAKLEQCPKPFLQAASRAAQKKLDAFEPQVRTSWPVLVPLRWGPSPSCADRWVSTPAIIDGAHGGSLTASCCIGVRRAPLSACLQSMSMMLWGYAKMGYNPGPLLWRSQGKVAARLSQMEGQHLANIMWAYATLAHQPGRLMAEAGEEASMRISELKPQEVRSRTRG